MASAPWAHRPDPTQAAGLRKQFYLASQYLFSPISYVWNNYNTTVDNPHPEPNKCWKGICSHWKNELKPQRIKIYLYYSSAEELHQRLIAVNAVLTHISR